MAMPSWTIVAIAIVSCLLGLSARSEAAQYLGKFLGKLTELHHGVSGEVYAVDARTLHIKDFTYDGQGPAAYFFAGNSRAPGNAGFRIRDENGSGDVLRRYRKEGVTITLPEGKSLNSIKWFSVWCEEFEVNFGDVKIPKNFEYPRPQKIDGLRGVHGVSSDNIVIVDAQTLLVPNLSYDGEAPDAKFWVGRGPKPSPQGIRVPDENGKENALRRYDHKTIVLTLPGDLTVFDIGHFGIWCEAFTVDFGHVQIPQAANVPPSLKMLGVSPQSKLNCEVLHDDLAFEVRWAVAGDSIVLQLVAKLDDREYMTFGISGDSTNSVMVGGDVGVAWVDKDTLKGYADDYFLDAKSQCSGRTGSCPDTRIADNTNNIRILNAAMVNGYSIVTYQRPLRASDKFDKQIFTNQSQPVIWAIGPLNQRDEVSFHSLFNKRDRIIDFGRAAKWNCPMPEGDQPPMKPVTTSSKPPPVEEEEYEAETPKPTRGRNNERRRGSTTSSSARQELKDSEKSASRTRTTERRGNGRNTPRPVPTPAPAKKTGAWFIPPIQCNEPEDGVFFAQMGPTGGKHGYPAITGHVGWGISWYINGLLIPEINVVRGKSYNFVVEGGFDPEVPAKYHPFYITDDPVGGYAYKNPEEQKNVKIFAGAKVSKDGAVHPTGVGRLCHWTHEGDSDADDFDSFGAYQRTLKLKCDLGEPGVIQWTPDKNTPDTVYYQCFTHRYLGWKINVLDSCDIEGAASEIHETKVLPEDPMEDLDDSPSIRIETRIKPNDIQVFNKDLMTSTDKIDNFEEEDTEQNTFTVIDMNNSSSTPQILTVQELPKVDNDWSFRTSNNEQQTGFLGKTNNHTFTYVQLLPPMKPPSVSYGKVVVRRPVMGYARPPFMMKPAMKLHRRPPMMSKKPYYRPMTMRPVMVRIPNKYDKPMILALPPNPHNVVFMKPHIRNTIVMPEIAESHVEISAQQPSTEREPGLVTAKPILAVKEEKRHKPYVPLYPAINTGFNPASVVIESGFKPIMSKDIQRRFADEQGPEVEIESEIGVIDETKEPTENAQKATEFFEPMFIPSPTINDQIKKAQLKNTKPKKSPVRYYLKRGRRTHEDEVPAAAERVESYYLPPDNNKAKPVERPRYRSNIDVPPGTVVTYDGKKLSGASLTIRTGEQRSVLEGRTSKAAEFIKARPQFVPFRGELPPLDVKSLNLDAPQLKSRGLNRDLDTPEAPGSTKLKRVTLENRSRSKREAHHTEEHTAEQERERQAAAKQSSANHVQITLFSIFISVLFTCILKL